MSTHARLAGLLLLLMAATVAGYAEPYEALFSKLSARAEAGSADAQYHLGMLYNNGIGTDKNPRLAFQWFVSAAKAGDPLGSYKVGCYYAGQFKGVVPPDREKALTHKLVAAKAGYVLAQHDVALAYAVRGDHKEAAKWWQMAAAQGDVSAMLELAYGYRKGVGVPLNPGNAYEYLLIVNRLVSEREREALGVKPLLDELRKAIDIVAATQAERNAEGWTKQSTELTMRSFEGLDAARRAAQ